MADLTKQDLTDAFSAALKANGGGNSSAGSGSSSAAAGGAFADKLKEATGAFNPLTAATNLAGTAFEKGAQAVKAMHDVIQPGLDTWRKLSSSGANFNNDVVGMTAAAAGSRLSLSEFQDVIGKNTKSFTALGGNVAQGAQAFTNLSKEMFDSGVTDQLKLMGMTSKDVNDALALTVANQYTVNLNDEKSKKQAILSATELATEMDQMAKLTGKTRQEQEEAQKKLQADAQFQSRLQLDTMNMTETQALEYRNKVTQAAVRAEAEGNGEAFKEYYATQTLQSQEAATKSALFQEQTQATFREVDALRKQDYKTAGEEQKNREVQISKDAKNVGLNQLATLGNVTEASKAAGSMLQSQRTTAAAYESTLKELNAQGKLKGLSEKEQDELVRKTMDSKLKETQTKVDPSTEAMVKLGARAEDVQSAFMNKIVVPINKDLNPALEQFTKGLLNSKITDATRDGKPVQITFTKGVEEKFEQGRKEGQQGTPAPAGPTNSAIANQAVANTKQGPGSEGLTFTGSNAIQGIAQGIGTAEKFVKQLTSQTTPAKETGGVVPGTDKGTTVTVGEKGKPEAIVPLDQLKNMISSGGLPGLNAEQIETLKQGPGERNGGKGSPFYQEALAMSQKMMSEMAATTASINDKSGSGGLDMTQISKLVNATISDAGGKSPTNAVDIEKELSGKQKALAESEAKGIPKLGDIEKELSGKQKALAESEAKGIPKLGDIKNPADQFGDMFGNLFGGKGKDSFLKDITTQMQTATKIDPTSIKKPEDHQKEAEAKAKAEMEAKKKEPAPVHKDEDKKPAPATGEVTMKDLHTSLEHLNSSIKQMLSYTQQTVTLARDQVKATKGLTGNRFA